jgi:hypothetical protein
MHGKSRRAYDRLDILHFVFIRRFDDAIPFFLVLLNDFLKSESSNLPSYLLMMIFMDLTLRLFPPVLFILLVTEMNGGG